MPAFWVELGLSNQHVPGSHAQHGLLFEKKGAGPERGRDPLSCEADTSARQLPGLWDRVPVLGASNYVDQVSRWEKGSGWI